MNVLQEWMNDLSWKMQTVIITGIRGCDGLSKKDVSKHISRAIRQVSLRNADATTTYMNHPLDEAVASAKLMCDDLDKYPVHFVLHLAHACEIIGYKHPLTDTREKFIGIYRLIVWNMHLQPETELMLDHRLSDRKETVKA